MKILTRADALALGMWLMLGAAALAQPPTDTRPVSREWTAARPGDLLYFRQAGGRQPDHLMIVVGPSRFDPSASDFVVYHTGPDDGGAGEMRKVRLADLRRHPAARWRPSIANPAFVGVFRPAPL